MQALFINFWEIVLNIKVFKSIAFSTFFIFLFYLLHGYFIHTNTILYTNFYANVVTKEFLEVLDLCNRLHDSYNHYKDCFIAISVLKYKNYSKFYLILLILSGDTSSYPVPTQNSVFQSFWKPFKKKGFHIFHLNINSIVPKLYKLKTIAGNTKAVIIGITESKVDNSLSNREV